MLAMLVRADNGGLGVQTWEIARHVRPDRVLVVDVHPRRGDLFRPNRYDDIAEWKITTNPVLPDDLAWLTDGADILFSSETFYLSDQLPPPTTQLVLLANPELFMPHYADLAQTGAIKVYAPTEWERRRLGANQLLLQPVARDRIAYRQRTGPAQNFVHISAGAMCDRNGTDLVGEACALYDGPPITMHVAGPHRPDRAIRTRACTVVPLADVTDYWSRWEAEFDVLVQPRRYGGLSLLVQEAAAAGIPAITLERFPESSWPQTYRVPCTPGDAARMKGGMFRVAQADAQHVAEAMAALASSDLAPLSEQANRYADATAWSTLLPAWNAALRPEAITRLGGG